MTTHRAAHLLLFAPMTLVLAYRPGNAAVTLAPMFDAYSTGVSAPSLAVGDLDEDGLPDVVLGSSTGNAVYVLLGRPGGSFPTPSPVTAGSSPRGVALADLNGDGHLDLVTANEAGVSVSVLLGAGDGTFAPPSAMAQPAAPRSLALRDLDLDGQLDVIVLSRAGRSVTVRMGAADGAFGPVISTLTTPKDPQSFALGEVTGDAYADLAVASTGDPANFLFDGGVHLYSGLGNGSFVLNQTIDAHGPADGVGILDLDGDSRNDIYVAKTGNSPRTSVYYGNGDGTFAPRVDLAATTFTHIARSEIGGDGIPDLVVTAGEGIPGVLTSPVLGIGVYDGLAARSFGPRVDYGAGCSLNDFVMGDVDLDGHADVLIATTTGLSVLRNTESGFRTPIRLAASGYVLGLDAADLDGDGKRDLVASVPLENRVAVLLGHGDGTFSFGPGVTGLSVPFGPRLADMNGDGNVDLVLVTRGDSTLRILPGLGNGTFGPSVNQKVGDQAFYLDIGDLDGNGMLDVVVGDSPNVTVLLRKSNGTFHAPIELPTPTSWYCSIVLRDLNGDGSLDIAATNANALHPYDHVWINSGNGQTFTRTDIDLQPYSVAQTSDIAVGDLDGDGLPDLVTSTASYLGDACRGTSQLVFVRGLGNGTFEAPRLLSMPAVDPSLSLVDLDLDGRADVAAPSRLGLAVRSGNGTLTPDPVRAFGCGATSTDHVIADFNGDGWPDAAVLEYSSNSVAILLNRGAVTAVGPPASGGAVRLDVRPQPARSQLTLSFLLPAAGRVSLRILDVQGRVVRTLVNGSLPAGPHAFRWNRESDRGARAASGVFWVELKMPGGRRTGRAVVLD